MYSKNFCQSLSEPVQITSDIQQIWPRIPDLVGMKGLWGWGATRIQLKSIIAHQGKAINEQLEAPKGSRLKARIGCQNQEITPKAKAPEFVVKAYLPRFPLELLEGIVKRP